MGRLESLRARRLRPGPGKARAEVEQNQRRRLYGATIALVAEKGYQATTLAELCSLSGVSSRSFYDLFASKDELFLETLKAVIELAIEYAVSKAALTTGPAGAPKTTGGSGRGAASTPSSKWSSPSRPRRG